MADKEKSFWQGAKPYVYRYMPAHRGLLIAAFIAGAVAATSAAFCLPWMVENGFPIVFKPELAPDWVKAPLAGFAPERQEDLILWGAALLLTLIMTLRGMSAYLNGYLLNKAGMRMLNSLRTDVFARLQYLPLAFHDRQKQGDLISVVIQFTQSLQTNMVMVLNDFVIQGLTLIAGIGYLIYKAMTNEQSAILLGNLLVVGICVPAVRIVGKRIVRIMRRSLKQMMVLTSCVEESLVAQREVRSFNLESRQEQAVAQSMNIINRAQIKVAAWHQGLSPTMEVLCSLGLAYALYRGTSNGLTLAQFSGIAAACYYCFDAAKRLGSAMNHCRNMQAMVERIDEVMHATDDTPEPQVPHALAEKTAGAVSYHNVSFSYDAQNRVLHDINIEVPAGQVVALVGPSGSGKTTFINMLCRFYDPQSGCVSIDGIDLKNISRADRTRSVGLVSQFPVLFRGSIRENIRAGKPEASDAEVAAAAEQAGMHDFVSEGEGYERQLREGGVGLSGGQRQRVSLARAFLKNAPILILDEATSALDMKSEALVQESLDKLAAGQTTFIIAHRFSTIRMATRILVFNEGRIVGDGSHAELYQSSALYRSLYDEQVKQAQKQA